MIKYIFCFIALFLFQFPTFSQTISGDSLIYENSELNSIEIFDILFEEFNDPRCRKTSEGRLVTYK